MTFVLGSRSRANLAGVHPDLVRVVERAIQLTPTDFMVIDGMRSKEEQLVNLRKGVSKTRNSAHLVGHAIDFVPWRDTDGDGDAEVSWAESAFPPIGAAFKRAAAELGIAIDWGGDWTWKDWGHIELDDGVYRWRDKAAALWA